MSVMKPSHAVHGGDIVYLVYNRVTEEVLSPYDHVDYADVGYYYTSMEAALRAMRRRANAWLTKKTDEELLRDTYTIMTWVIAPSSDWGCVRADDLEQLLAVVATTSVHE